MSFSIAIPAAGASRRMGGADKLLRVVDGVPLIRRTALQALAGGRDITVTLRIDDADRREALADLPLRRLPVPDAEEGMSASLRLIAAQTRPGDGVLILPADMPEIGAGELARMAEAEAKAPDRILQATSAGHPGHPVLFPHDLLPEFAELTGDAGAKSVLVRHKNRIHPVPLFGQRAALDLDTPEDWASWQESRVLETAPAGPLADPLAAAQQDPENCVLAVITAVHGTGWRRPGAMMCLWRDGRTLGQLTGGCIEADLLLHVAGVLDAKQPRILRYGLGSPFFDIRLPCGGGLDITLTPLPDRRVLADLICLKAQRAPTGLRFGTKGGLGLDFCGQSGWAGPDFYSQIPVPLRFLVFGNGEEAQVFSHIARAAGYDVLTPSEVTNDRPGSLAEEELLLLADTRTAVLTFFHDHDHDARLIAAALRGPSPYIGALGSRRAAERRLSWLRSDGLHDPELSRLRAPVGLIPATRNPRALAISILAEIESLGLAPP